AYMMPTVTTTLAEVARRPEVKVVNAVPNTGSGKVMRRWFQALAEQRHPVDVRTLDDPGAV
ncbi:hypothetical protein, partial [Stenotrophomonas muris]|uniref:hypothetical protein n=1 Tax=Stenotrophomonas muris TaxID=2963283 RepID=UPI00383A3DEB